MVARVGSIADSEANAAASSSVSTADSSSWDSERSRADAPSVQTNIHRMRRDTRQLRTCCRDVVHDPWVRQRLRCGESFSVIFDQQIVYEILCFVGHVTPELLRVVKCSSLDCSEELRIVLLIEWRETAK